MDKCEHIFSVDDVCEKCGFSAVYLLSRAQQRIDAHNERCEKKCSEMKAQGVKICNPIADWHKCAYCPRRYMIED